jgi:Tfp pilus assembly protein PilV
VAQGAFLIEALVALLVFSMTTAGTFALLASAFRASGNAAARMEATDVAVAALGQMSVEEIPTLGDRYDAQRAGQGYRAIAASAKRLPGVTDTANLPVVSVTAGPSLNSRRISIVVFWQLPNDTAPHRAVVSSVVAQ